MDGWMDGRIDGWMDGKAILLTAIKTPPNFLFPMYYSLIVEGYIWKQI
jgi:hypothetical protein